MLKKILILAVVGALCLAGGGWNRLNACPHSTTITYYGWIVDADGFAGCNYLLISPEPPQHYGVVGQEIDDCDGNYTSWGLTYCDNYTVTHTQCDCAP